MMSLSPHINIERTFAVAVLSDDPTEIGKAIGRFIVELMT
jgi:hypothetical protein